MNCGLECVKYLLFIFNFIFALCGLAILVCGVLVHYSLAEIAKTEIELNLSLPATVLIAIGAVVFIIAFFGCCGAIRESHCMIVTFAVLLLTLLIIQVAIGVLAFIELRGNDVQQGINKQLEKAVHSYFTPSPSQKVLQDGLNALQSVSKCCGYTSYRDYLNDSNNKDNIIPYGCCGKLENQQCSVDEVSNVKGCSDKLYPLLVYYATSLGGLALGIAAVELIGIIFSFCLANSIRNVERRGYKV